jgi:hypothetical protein
MTYTKSIKVYASLASLEKTISQMKVQLKPIHVAEYII